ncbi:TPA: glycosyltransferase family 29 protein [Campylobacter jejuni]|uniref:glycosyltransferase family 29 protein n=1 Tax=Campylobacter jejuni TaxID=197 RepID=UPI00069C6239|nr:glycosyltransferase family 29 protein [Campylobacter jejuni]MCV3396102.1 glycosyltransferase family 29 protein [Campylobacter lari]EAL0605553.1 glycosyltransferase [Campylobacter jejuni]ECK7518526.1 glycosyltransferase [Campylobacter jejuni]ECK8497885.1 glycosyltransferase [Campylobacter jejuni]ECL1931386.1 glycosyltransferase [Campylobacter jejuni]
MNQIGVSVIVPCYNVVDYVAKCLQSLCKQTLEELEIIIINDGSTDDTHLVIEDFIKRNNNANIQYFYKENGGYGSAVNLGIYYAKGEYIAICEPDDYVDEMYYEILYNIAKDESMEVVLYNGYIENRPYFSHLAIATYTSVKLNCILSFDERKNRFMFYNVGITLAIYKKEFLLINQIVFPENCKVYQDVPFVGKVFSICKKIRYVMGAKYYYLRGRAEQSVANPSRFIDIIPAIKDLVEFLISNENKLLLNKAYVLGFAVAHLIGRYQISIACNALDTAKKIKNYIETVLCDDVILQLSSKIFLKNNGFNVDKVLVHRVDLNSINYYSLPTIQNFSLQASYNEIISYMGLKLLFAQNENFSFSVLKVLEWELSYFINIPMKDPGEQIKEVCLKLLNSCSANILIDKFPKLVACVSILLNKSIEELTIPVSRLREDAAQILDWFYNRSAINIGLNTQINLCKEIKDYFNQSEERFLNYIKNKTICVVGNSPCELNKNRGHIIDSYDIVIRFNNYKIKGFEKDYGSKTNVWAISPALETITIKDLSQFDFIVSNDSSFYTSLFERSSIYKIMLLDLPFFQIQTLDFVKGTQLRTLSHGIVMLCYLLKHRKRLKDFAYYGFSLAEQSQGISHYYNGDPSNGKILPFHDWTKEVKILQQINKELKQC